MLLDNQKMTSNIQFEKWTADQVAEWLRGVDMEDAMIPYMHYFLNSGVDGRRLLLLTHADLEKLNVVKLGHQELILEAIDLLRTLRYGYETENLQSLALQLGCKARSLKGEVRARMSENDRNRANVAHTGESRPKRLSIGILSTVADLVGTLKSLVGWMDKAPFSGFHDLCLTRNTIVKMGLDLINMCQREATIIDVEHCISNTAGMLSDICEKLVIGPPEGHLDPLYVQPASLELATIRKKQGEELGMHILSSYYGVHVISGIKDMSPADLCGKIEKGDEVIQVNLQTVVGWQLQKLVNNLKAKPKEVILLLKKRPRHISPYAQMPNKKKNQNLINKHPAQVSTLPKSLKKLRSRDGESKQLRPSLPEFVNSVPSNDELYSPKDANDGNDTDNDVFRSGSESPQFTLPVQVDPKQRRATVSGGSPTLSRPLLVIEDIDTPSRPKSFTICGTSADMPHEIIINSPSGENLADLHKIMSSMEKRKDYQTKSTPASLDQFNVCKPTPKIIEPTKDQADGKAVFTTTITVRPPDSEIDTPTKANSPNDPNPAEQEGAMVGDNNDHSNNDAEKSEKQTSVLSEQTVQIGEKVTGSPERVVIASGDTIGEVNKHPERDVPSPERSKQSSDRSTESPSGEAIYSRDEVHSPERSLQSPERRIQSPDRPLDSSTDSVPPSESSLESSHTCTSSLESSSHSLSLDEGSVLPGEKDVLDFAPAATATASPSRQRRVLGMGTHHGTHHSSHHTEVAGSGFDKNQPQLVKIRKIDSVHVREPDKGAGKGKHVMFQGVDSDKELDENQSYVCKIVGGVVQKIPTNFQGSPSGSPSGVRRRPKTGRSKVNRRVSCKDLGKGDCEGYLYKRKKKGGGPLSSHWQKRWCVIKNYNLFCYLDKEALKAEVVVHLPAFQISPVPQSELKTKKFAFKVHNAGTSFLFASDRREDMPKWMKKMGLAAIMYDITSKAEHEKDCSESENEDDGHSDGHDSSPEHAGYSPKLSLKAEGGSSARSSSSSLGLQAPGVELRSSQVDLTELVRKQSRKGHNIFGEDILKQRQSALSRDLEDQVSPELIKFKKIKSLERTLRSKEEELAEIENALSSRSPEKLKLLNDILHHTSHSTESDT